MLKKLFVLLAVCITVSSCASWFTSSQEIPDSPTVGGKQDSSDMLFGQAESNPAPTPAPSVAPAASAPTAAASAKAPVALVPTPDNASVAK